ncbi:helix-turn-helix domain-containing protein [Apilactobacillus xinyiensis]|uniref:helix-turn-helix domain-containing protein n=1 Tax=Apilactobacillus xinyiensis TaxID=2841032 RepID=UPI00200C72EF|nr:helix-turn-helix transcriptional regulator [Apilactobacillus xinyiensis]MCL0330561.1 helix-turn-helix transcriptional regulator [Apilactobacillus xinyiensis]
MVNDFFRDLRIRRKKLGLTQEQLAQKCLVSTNTIKKWERRKGTIKKEDILRYAKVLDMDPMQIIDPEHKFKHFSDRKINKVKHIPTVNNITNICLDLEPKRLNNVYNFGSGQLEEQQKAKVTLDTLERKMHRYELKVSGTINGDRNIEFWPEDKKYIEEFNGIVPEEFDLVFKINTNDLYPIFRKNQTIFLKRAYTWNLFSTNFVIIKNKYENLKIMQFISDNNKIYLLPVSKDNEKINEHQKRFLMKPEEEILFVIKLSGY